MTKSRVSVFSLIVMLTVVTSAHAQMPQSVKGDPVVSLAPLVEEVSPAVVNIRVVQRVTRQNPFGNNDLRRFFGLPDSPQGRTQEIPSAGSGVIVDAERGLILTNHHVIGEADEIQIFLFDGTVLDAEVVGSDPGTDIAVIRVEADGLVDMPIGDSETARVGDFVIAIGNPFGLGHTVTSGIISALGRTINAGGYEDFIQTDASINPGNSGGALVNMNGELIGINSAIISRTGGNVGIGFAVPTEIAGSIMRQLLDFGEVRRGLLGVDIATIDPAAAEALGDQIDRGAIIQSVAPDSAAENAGLQVGDIIVNVDDKKIDSARDLINAIGLRTSGEEVNVVYYRGNERRQSKAVLGSRADRMIAGETIHEGLAGSVFAAAATTDEGGVEIAQVADGSVAAQRGLRTGDLITRVNRIPVSDLSELVQVAARYRILFLDIRRGDRDLMFQIR